MERTIFEPKHDEFRATVRSFLEEEVVPVYPDWERDKMPPREFWKRAGELGILGIGIPEELGGMPDSDFRHSVIVTEEAQRLGLAIGGLRVHTDICMPYFLEYTTEEQRERWLPRLASGEAVTAVAMSEPGAGSDMKAMSTRAKRDGDHYIVNGAKTFISNGRGADLVILAVKTDPEAGRKGISLLVVEASADGFEKGPPLEKVGQKAQDLCELYFTDTPVPVADRLGEENLGFEYLTSNLASERLSIAVNSQAGASSTLDAAVDALSPNGNGSKPSQNVKFELAACAAEVEAGQSLVDRCIDANLAGTLTPADAAAAKLFCTELQGRVTDRCVQLFGASGYEAHSRIGRAFADARVSRIYGGSSEIMKVIVAQDLGL